MQVRGGTIGGGAGKASSMGESAAHSETSDSNSAGDATAAVAVAATYKSVILSVAAANESNIITEENYYILLWLYRIRRVSCAGGLRIVLQPDFIWSIYRSMMRSKKLRRTDGDISVAADLWCFDRAARVERDIHERAVQWKDRVQRRHQSMGRVQGNQHA